MKFCYTNIETLTSFGLLVTKYALCKRGERGKKTKTHTKAWNIPGIYLEKVSAFQTEHTSSTIRRYNRS